MPITFLDEEEEDEIVATPRETKGKRKITFLDEEELPAEGGDIKPAPEVLTTESGRKITFLDDKPSTSRLPQLPEAPETPEFVPPVPKESILRSVADPFLNVAAGINDIAKGFADSFGADNPVSQNLAKNAEWYRDLL